MRFIPKAKEVISDCDGLLLEYTILSEIFTTFADSDETLGGRYFFTLLNLCYSLSKIFAHKTVVLWSKGSVGIIRFWIRNKIVEVFDKGWFLWYIPIRSSANKKYN